MLFRKNFLMDEEEYSRLNQIIQNLCKMPLNSYFIMPDYDSLVGYKDIIKTQMDFSTIQDKIQNHIYKSRKEWYDDIILIYDNAIEYHKITSLWGQIADFQKKLFIKKYFPLTWETPQEWYSYLSKAIKKLNHVLSENPISQGIDPVLSTIIETARTFPPVQNKLISESMNLLNEKMSNPASRWSVIKILKETQPDFVLADQLTIKAEKLCDHALNSLALYAQMFMNVQ